MAGAVDGGAGSACEPARKRTARLSSVLIYLFFSISILIIIQVLMVLYSSATDTVASSSSISSATATVVPVPGYYCTAVPGSSACVHCISML